PAAHPSRDGQQRRRPGPVRRLRPAARPGYTIYKKGGQPLLNDRFPTLAPVKKEEEKRGEGLEPLLDGNDR
ncbi:uncharacterized protein FOMMEDRAFT_16739, partial [Fomitiporia mediterranea MF3/22]|uniref:uncharacterized protein n=1 Tax=Fomitiporia mediterranea (strain MF3/22) TaxID=694068 RepID=UPI0004409182